MIRVIKNQNHYGPSNPQSDYRGGNPANRGGKCPCNDAHIISSLLDNHIVYLQGTDAAKEVKGAEVGNKGKSLQINTLLDTGALGVDGNYISPKMANKMSAMQKRSNFPKSIQKTSSRPGPRHFF